jgi:hypothetical protein
MLYLPGTIASVREQEKLRRTPLSPAGQASTPPHLIHIAAQAGQIIFVPSDPASALTPLQSYSVTSVSFLFPEQRQVLPSEGLLFPFIQSGEGPGVPGCPIQLQLKINQKSFLV